MVVGIVISSIVSLAIGGVASYFISTKMLEKKLGNAKNVAESFGGGGHPNASGCKIFGSYDEIKQRLIDSTLEVLGWKK